MFRSFKSLKSLFVLVMLAGVLAACAPAIADANAVPTSAPTTSPASSHDQAVPVDHVEVEVGVGSPIPVNVIVDGSFPDTCAQIGEIKQRVENFNVQITLSTISRSDSECARDPLPFRVRVPLNAIALSKGEYTISANGMSTTFNWPSAPTITPEPISETPAANRQTYLNTTLGIEVDYPAGWLLESAGDTAILWSRRPARVGVGGVPSDVAKIDISSESNSTLTLEELVARQKQGVAEVNGKILSEEEWTLAGGLRAVRMSVSAIGDSVTLMTVVNGHPVVLTGFGDVSRFDEVARSVRLSQ
jgi:hypothetical protein